MVPPLAPAKELAVRLGHRLLVAAAALLSACGGGGTSDPPPATTPASGFYQPVLKAQGPVDVPSFGLSLLHAAQPDIEFVIEPGAVTDTRIVASGSVDAVAFKVTALQPQSLLYIVGGDVRRLPLSADGREALTRLQKAQTTSACRFVLDGDDYAEPDRSRFVVTTAGADGLCGTADDGRAEVHLDGGGVALLPLSGDPPLALLRNPDTLAPEGYLGARSLSLWQPAPGSSVATRFGTDPALGRVVLSTPRSALAEYAGRLTLFSFLGGLEYTETPLSAALTAGTDWQAIGFDTDSLYVFRNGASGWSVLKIDRGTPNVTQLARGSGSLASAAMGSQVLFASVIGSAANQLLRIGKSGGAPVVQESTDRATLATVLAGAAGVHQLWRITRAGGVATAYTIEMIDEGGAKLYSTDASGYALALPDATTLNLDASESRTRFVFASGYGARGFGDAALIAYDTQTRKATGLGVLPGSAAFGSDAVLAGVTSAPSNRLGGFAARVLGAAAQADGAQVFAFDVGIAGSLKIATRTP